MTIVEMDNACQSQSSIYEEVSAFDGTMRDTQLQNIVEGEEIVIPESYKIWKQRMMRNGVPVTNALGEPTFAQFINANTSAGRSVRFYPTSLCKIAFAVDGNTGKDLVGAGRVVPTKGNVADFARGKSINSVMEALKGCTIKLEKNEAVKIRQFGVKNEDATKESVQETHVGTWTLVGDKKPAGWPA